MTAPKNIPERLTAIVDSIVTFGSFRQAARAADCRERVVYSWLAASKDQSRRGDKSAPYYFEHQGKSDYFHTHCANSKSANALGILYQSLEMVRLGRTEEVRDPSSGYRLQKLNPKYLHMSDQEIIDAYNYEDPLNPIAPNPARLRYLFKPDGSPDFEERQVMPSASLHSHILKAILPGAFGDKISVDSVQRISVLTVPAPKFVPPTPLQIGQLKTVPTVDDIKAQRLKEAEAFLARPDRTTKPNGPVEIYGRAEPSQPLHGDADSGAARPTPEAPVVERGAVRPTSGPVHPVVEQPVAPVVEQAPALPSYVRRPATDRSRRTEPSGDPIDSNGQSVGLPGKRDPHGSGARASDILGRRPSITK